MKEKFMKNICCQASHPGPDVVQWTGPTGIEFREVRQPSGTYYRDTCSPKVIDALEYAMKHHRRVWFRYGDPEGKVDWLDEHDCYGFIGRSMGPLKVPLILKSRKSDSGPAILCDSITRIIVKEYTDWVHPKYVKPTIRIQKRGPHMITDPKLLWILYVNGEPHAYLPTESKAVRLRDFLLGERLTP